ncbi:hypothetical protein L917_12296 [Phytophthora nicotianae]|nr:hypothetical protein L915_12549 [Phytophthora nicotianae]ETL88629.1 hypothetical protein L917_12296 [Phytophthora nicotianae]
MRTQSERYREAVRDTHLIASEMADIQDDEEFEEMLNIVLSQWRNVRQRKKRAIRVSGSVVPDDKSVCDQMALEVAAKRKFDLSSSDNEDQPGSSPWFEAAESGRKLASVDTLQDLLDALDEDKPGLLKTQRCLSGVIIRHGGSDNKKPKLKICKNPVLVQDPSNLLPSKLLDACLKVLPLSNTKSTAISIDGSQPSQSHSSEEKAAPQSVETVLIKDVGQFSRKQIEIFKRVRNLKEVVELGLGTYKWMTEIGIPALPAENHGLAKKIAEKVESTYPYQQIQGLPVTAKRICYYVPLNQPAYMNAAKEVAVSLKNAGLNKFDVIPQNNPIQFDGFSCGVFVCWMFIRQITSVPPQNMSDASLPRRRFELFCYLLTGRLLPAEAVATALTEEKAPAPETEDNDMDEEEVAPIQVADK